MPNTDFLKFIIIGDLRQEYIIPVVGKAQEELLGGSTLYSAAGIGLWGENSGIVARVNESFPLEQIDAYERKGFDFSGVKVLTEALDSRSFYYYPDADTVISNNPLLCYSQIGESVPKLLLGFVNPPGRIDSRTISSVSTIRPNDFPAKYLDAQAAHLAPADFLTHSLIPSFLKQGSITTVTVNAGEGYMNPSFFDDIPTIVKGLHAFITSENKLRKLFEGRSTDLIEMTDAMGTYDTETIVVLLNSRGQLIYDTHSKKRWMLPAYPSLLADPTGYEDAFCGGYLTGYRASYSPLTGALYGNISASFAIEGTGPMFILGSLPGLAEARLEWLKNQVQDV
ncbi:MAG: carbohydrate kinase family protein [Anaerolineaceae bacterium]|nr:carbohydrate kinase family protein [Anaerolineaceae bacterium]